MFKWPAWVHPAVAASLFAIASGLFDSGGFPTLARYFRIAAGFAASLVLGYLLLLAIVGAVAHLRGTTRSILDSISETCDRVRGVWSRTHRRVLSTRKEQRMTESMTLHTAIVGVDEAAAKIHDLVDAAKIDGVEIGITPQVATFQEASAALDRSGVNSVVIVYPSSRDAAVKMVEFIEDRRGRQPDIVFCICGTRRQLKSKPGIPRELRDKNGELWRKRLDHFYKIEKDQDDEALKKAVENILAKFRKWRLGWIERQTLRTRLQPDG